MPENRKRIHHDLMFKWLVSAFVPEFFAWYFPNVKIGDYALASNELYEACRQFPGSRNPDLFLLLTLEMDGKWENIVVIFEHKSYKNDVRTQIMDYACYAWLLKRKRVWPIVWYTDDRIWSPEIYGNLDFLIFEGKRQSIRCDIIKLNRDKCSDLMARKSPFCNLISLKASPDGTQREALVKTLYANVKQRLNELDNNTLLLIEEFVTTYSQLPEKELMQIKQEVNMNISPATITEYYVLQAEKRGEKRGQRRGEKLGEKRGVILGQQRGEILGQQRGEILGQQRGEAIGLLKGSILSFDNLLAGGLISQEIHQQKVGPLKIELEKLLASNSQDIDSR